MAKRAEGSKQPPLPDLRFIQHANLETLLNPANHHQLKAIADSEQRHLVCSRDLQRRLDLSQGLSEACQHVNELVAKIALLRESVHESESDTCGGRRRNLYDARIDNLIDETETAMTTLDISSSATSAAEESSTESISSRASVLARTQTTATSPFVVSMDQSFITFKPFCNHQTCPICHSHHPNPQLAPAAQTLPNLEWLAKMWIDRLRVLRAQWQAGGKNLEKWEGHTQSHWLGQGERRGGQRGGGHQRGGDSGRQSRLGRGQGAGRGNQLSAPRLGIGIDQTGIIGARMIGPQWPIPDLQVETWQTWMPLR